ncbi:Cof-type HAD-IIB family hydrolase [Anaerotalea alkaliphila]|uniref:HAD family phosphatase n=1 Tax=Anaerotalea alkaliphila TaxID=2662126 RepID=A0A7X5KLW1_9FIRM|nr:Cof-type HAD-IIB family hydrolase [Anaerotalea alkaliphila]NDL67129.1 HAD family phosphatase [Anaerotalea alkaliphila]
MERKKRSGGGVPMERYVREYEEGLRRRLEAPGNLEGLRASHRRMIGWIQHERLVHLLVTLFAAAAFLFAAGMVIFLEGGWTPGLLGLLSLVLLLGYLRHYRLLENTVQAWYLLHDRMEAMDRYKLVCLDIDGTLLDATERLTTPTVEAVRKVAARGIPVVPVTARPPQGVGFLLEELGIQGPMACYNGAQVLEGEEVLVDRTIPLDVAREIWERVRGEGVSVNLYHGRDWMASGEDEWTGQEGRIVRSRPQVAPMEEVFDRWERTGTSPNKILCMGEPEVVLRLWKDLEPDYRDRLQIHPSKPEYLEIMPREASKRSAVEFLCRRLGISMQEVLAIGDNFNDLDMLTHAGMGVAMGNAPEEVKRQAGDVTASNSMDGVARALEKHLPEA